MNTQPNVGAGLLAKNDDAVYLMDRVVCFASKPAPTGLRVEARYYG